MDSLTDKIAIVTGASSGIGLAVATKLVAAGARVAMVARTQETLEREARALGDAAVPFALDVTDFERLQRLPGEVARRLGGLDILVNNAGLNHRGPLRRHSPTALADVIATNLSAPIVLTRAALDHLRPGGAIVNVASLAGMVPVPDEAAYSASKAGLRAFTRAAAAELPELTLSTVSPGPVDTSFFGDLAHVPDLVFSQPMSTAGEVADAVLRCIHHGDAEIALPRASGTLATFAYLFPKLALKLRPLMERRGAKNKERYRARKGLA